MIVHPGDLVRRRPSKSSGEHMNERGENVRVLEERT